MKSPASKIAAAPAERNAGFFSKGTGNSFFSPDPQGNKHFFNRVGKFTSAPAKIQKGPEHHDAKPSPPVITSTTIYSAPDGSPATRTDVGVGEDVEFKSTVKGKWSASGGIAAPVANDDTFNWTAPNRAAKKITIKCTKDKTSGSLDIKVVEPSDITGVKKDDMEFPAGDAGVGMHLTFNYGPKNVSFGNMEEREISGPASNISGFFKKHFKPDLLKHNAAESFSRSGQDNVDTGTDEASTHTNAKPFESGGFDLVIPNNFRVFADPDNGKKFTEVTQRFRMVDDTGKMTVEKAGASAERTP
jgi:hypothetical protein